MVTHYHPITRECALIKQAQQGLPIGSHVYTMCQVYGHTTGGGGSEGPGVAASCLAADVTCKECLSLAAERALVAGADL